jgi:flagellar biosynthesis protein
MTPADRPGNQDETGQRRPRWPAPRPQEPLAIALDKKGPSGARQPRVLASGRGAVAEQILEIAFAQGIPVREDADLAELLAAVEINAEIPIDAIAAVAEILSYIYRANAQAGDQAASGADERKDGAQ